MHKPLKQSVALKKSPTSSIEQQVVFEEKEYCVRE